MKKITLTLAIASIISFAPSLKAAVAIGIVENAATGFFFDSAGASLTSGGVSAGFFPTGFVPADSAFGTTITSWSTLLAAGYVDLRTIPGVTLATGLDWDYPVPLAGTVQNIPIGVLPAGTQLYQIAFNSGSFNTGTPAQSYLASSQWAVVKDNANISPADLGVKNLLLSTAIGTTEILVGTDNGVNVNLAGLTPVPEPATFAIGVLVAFAGLGRQRRQRHQV